MSQDTIIQSEQIPALSEQAGTQLGPDPVVEQNSSKKLSKRDAKLAEIAARRALKLEKDKYGELEYNKRCPNGPNTRETPICLDTGNPTGRQGFDEIVWNEKQEALFSGAGAGGKRSKKSKKSSKKSKKQKKRTRKNKRMTQRK